MRTKFIEIKEKIMKSKRIIVTAHINPDGDAIGAGLALTLALKKLEKECKIVLQDECPNFVKFLNTLDNIEKYDKNNKYDYDLIICVDSASKERVGDVVQLFKKDCVINIDHHISNTMYGDLNCVENISSTSELIYNFIKFLDVEIDIDMGEALYLGIVNDTGNFTHDNVTENTFLMASELRKIGVNNSKIIREFFNTKSYASLKLLGKALEKSEFVEEKKLMYSFISKDDLENFSGKKEDTEGIVERLLSYSKAEVSLFLREDEKGIIKGSMRSKYDKDVNKIAQIFGGGGHIKAAGFTTTLSYDKIVDEVIKNLK